MPAGTITDLSEREWEALKSIAHVQHNTKFDGDNTGTATTDTPGVGRTTVTYHYDSGDKTCAFSITEKPDSVPDEVVWFALGATVAHVSGAPAKSY